MTQSNGDGFRLWISRGTLATILGSIVAAGGLGYGIGSLDLVAYQHAAVEGLESCRRSENKCSEIVRQYEDFAAEAVPILETVERGRPVAAQARLPRHLRSPAMGNSR